MFSLKKMLQAAGCFLIVVLLLSVLPATAFAEEMAEHQADATILYLKPNKNWKTDDAWFALYYFDNNDNYNCVAMSDEDGDEVYEAILPAGYSNFLFYRMDSTITDFDGEYVLHQTDCFEYTEGKCCYVLAEDSWESGNWEAVPEIGNAATDATTESTHVEENSNVPEDVPTTTEADDFVESTEESATQTKTKTIYLSLEQVDQNYTWSVETQDAVYYVTAETDGIYSIELPVDTDTIILHGENEDDTGISSVEISLTDIQENNCIVALACEDDAFEIAWGIYNPETEEVIISDESNLVTAEEYSDDTAPTIEESETIKKNKATEEADVTEGTEGAEETFGDKIKTSKHADAVS